MIKSTGRGFAVILLIGVMLGLIYGLNMLSKPEYDPLLNIAFVGTGEDADCIVIWQSDFAMMIDTGEAADAPDILEFLEEQGIHKLDYLILTHPDKDHIGSAVEIVHMLDVYMAVQPYYQKANDRLGSLNTRMTQEKVKVVIPSRVLHYSFDDVQIFIYPPREKHYDDDNNYSLGILIKHGDVNLFFPGDAEGKRLTEMLELDLPETDLLKFPHHGRYHDASKEMLTRLSPAYGVVTSNIVSTRLRAVCEGLGTELYFTVDNTVRFVSDGAALKLYP